MRLPHRNLHNPEIQANFEAIEEEDDAVKELLPSNGRVTEAGAIDAAGSGDWTVAKIGTGEYEVKWTTERGAASYAVVATPFTNSVIALVFVVETTAKVFKVRTFSSAGVQKDMPFSFIAVD